MDQHGTAKYGVLYGRGQEEGQVGVLAAVTGMVTSAVSVVGGDSKFGRWYCVPRTYFAAVVAALLAVGAAMLYEVAAGRAEGAFLSGTGAVSAVALAAGLSLRPLMWAVVSTSRPGGPGVNPASFLFAGLVTVGTGYFGESPVDFLAGFFDLELVVLSAKVLLVCGVPVGAVNMSVNLWLALWFIAPVFNRYPLVVAAVGLFGLFCSAYAFDGGTSAGRLVVPRRVVARIPELGTVPVNAELAAVIEEQVWCVRQDDPRYQRVLQLAQVGDKVLALLCASDGFSRGASRKEVSDDLCTLLTNAFLREEVKHLRPAWWGKASVQERGGPAASRFEASWGLYWEQMLGVAGGGEAVLAMAVSYNSWVKGARQRLDGDEHGAFVFDDASGSDTERGH